MSTPRRSGIKSWKRASPYGIKPIGLGARDTLRLEMGYCLYGNDIDRHYLAPRSRPGLDYQVHQRLHQQRRP
ncbi:MAG: hypothetical protein WKG07_39295 [Hymenobacter sp.]